MTNTEIAKRLEGGEEFTIFNTQYWIIQGRPGMCNDGLYDRWIKDKRGHRVGACRFSRNSVLLAFSYGRFNVKLKDFRHGANASQGRTWHPGDSPV
jgi:hypothetical protein